MTQSEGLANNTAEFYSSNKKTGPANANSVKSPVEADSTQVPVELDGNLVPGGQRTYELAGSDVGDDEEQQRVLAQRNDGR